MNQIIKPCTFFDRYESSVHSHRFWVRGPRGSIYERPHPINIPLMPDRCLHTYLLPIITHLYILPSSSHVFDVVFNGNTSNQNLSCLFVHCSCTKLKLTQSVSDRSLCVKCRNWDSNLGSVGEYFRTQQELSLSICIFNLVII